MKKRYFMILFFLFVMMCAFFSYRFYIFSSLTTDSHYPNLKLKGKIHTYLSYGQKYKEKGYFAYDRKDGNLKKKVKVIGKIDTKKLGRQSITYELTNSLGNKVRTKRFVTVEKSSQIPYDEKYDRIDNTIRNWGTNNKKDGKRPNVNISPSELLKYNAYAMGEDRKVLYLTFDEGTLETYLPKIVDALDENQVKGTFFLCHTYMKKNPKLIRKMVSNGHSIGNHTAHHVSMPSLAFSTSFSSFLAELIENEKLFTKITGKKMDLIYREPRGEFSLRTLSIMKDLGYHTYFWSAAYQDWDDVITGREAFLSMEERVHNGAIYLLHPTSKGNYLALSDFIKEMKKRGYTFDLVKNIP